MDTNLNNPKVTVLMPVYNGANFIAPAIRSILNQTYRDFELLIINDGSTDDTEKIIKQFQAQDNRIKLLNNAKNSGIVFSRNRGLDEAQTEYVAMMDSDDIALPQRLEKQIAFLEKNKEYALVGSWVKIIDEKGRATGDYWRNKLLPEEIPFFLMFHNCFSQSAITFRKSLIPPEKYIQGFAPTEDFDLWIRIADKNKTWNLQEVLIEYRVHLSNSQKVLSKEKQTALNAIFTKQLQKLNISPTPAELEIHETGYAYAGSDVIAFLIKKESWLQKLLAANEKIGYFDKNIFNQTVKEHWFFSCYANCSAGFAAWRLYWQSPLANWQLKKTTNIVKFLIKCWLRLA